MTTITTRPLRPRPATQAQMHHLYPDAPRQSQVKTFFAAMGRTIAEWQRVESGLYEVYRATTGARRPGAEACAFFAVPAFRTKLNLTNAAIQFALHSDAAALAVWATLFNRLGKKSDRRNEIAHGAVWVEYREKRTERKIYIGPPSMDFRESLKRKPGQSTEPLTLKRLREYEKDFHLLSQHLLLFLRKIPPP